MSKKDSWPVEFMKWNPPPQPQPRYEYTLLRMLCCIPARVLAEKRHGTASEARASEKYYGPVPRRREP